LLDVTSWLTIAHFMNIIYRPTVQSVVYNIFLSSKYLLNTVYFGYNRIITINIIIIYIMYFAINRINVEKYNYNL